MSIWKLDLDAYHNDDSRTEEQGTLPFPSSREPPVEQTTYWGVKCRTCEELVAFDVCPYLSFGTGAASMKPGAIRCSGGHNHIYFPRDFQFIPSSARIPQETMRENRDVYRAVNSTFPSKLQAPAPAPEQAVEPIADSPRKSVRPFDNTRWPHLVNRNAV
jgi:hypothetical protein